MTGLPGTARAIREHRCHRASAVYYAKTSVTGLPGTPRAIREHRCHRVSAN
jgi:molybdopterin biosynthesis enzyme MoaB